MMMWREVLRLQGRNETVSGGFLTQDPTGPARSLSVLKQHLDKNSSSLNDVKSRKVVTSQETENRGFLNRGLISAVSLSCDDMYRDVRRFWI